MKNKIYTYYFIVLTVFFFTVTYPLQLLIIQFKSLHFFGHKINQFIIKSILFFGFIKIEIINKKYINNKEKYIFCSNHSSYFDIATTYYLQNNYIKFIGKKSLEKIPLFGYMYKKLYITVDRRDKNSRADVFNKSSEAIDKGNSLCIYPEGAIPHQTPNLIPFKDGAFKLSVEKNIPIVPVSFPFNHKVLPVEKLLFKSRHVKIIVHEPLNTPENPISDYKILRDKTFEIINNDLKNHKVI